jgi:deoxyribodipyrimidine photo-lyase
MMSLEQYISERTIKHKDKEIYEGEYIIYWMSRDQRINDNISFYYGFMLSKKYNKKFGVLFNIFSSFLDATIRQFDFMIKGLIELEENIIPPFVASTKQEFSAFTLRKKYEKIISKYLIEIPEIDKLTRKEKIKNETNWKSIYENLKIDKDVKISKFFEPGEKKAKETLQYFIKNKLKYYNKNRNDPNIDGLSNLSPYLHFWMISPLRVAIEVKRSDCDEEIKNAFLEELIIRRELAENFCFYNENYDNENGILNWAKMSLESHILDKREYIYTLKQFENGETHDDLWNACQKEMVITGKMHGYMRMYWAIIKFTKNNINTPFS